MKFDYTNASGAQVFEVETKRQLDCVMWVDTAAGEVCRAHQPLRVAANGKEIESYLERFEAIHPIFGLEPKAQLFHCYGRIA